MKLHLHVGVVETIDEITLNEALAVAQCAERVLVRLAPNLAVLECEDAEKVVSALEANGLHPKVMR
ncbi:MAG: hypothetical protein H6839_05055 [Planctomycetes bacterium]|nr:hypothetical protein [Planctomycetota bacterium]